MYTGTRIAMSRPMFRRFASLPILALLLSAQQPAWKEFAIGPSTGKVPTDVYNVPQGMLRASSISLRSLIGIIAGVPVARIVGPDWMDTEQYAVVATVPDES